MSAETRSQSRTQPHWSQHGRDRWHDERRNAVHDREPETGWREAVPVEYPSADDCRARYHMEGDCVILWRHDAVRGQRRPVIITVIDLSDRGPEEQAYVRCQAVYGRENRE